MSGVALITGTSSGIGLATAIGFAKAGFRSVATLRDVAKAGALRERAAREDVALEVRALDVEHASSVASCVAGVLRDFGAIDVLVNNAGAGFVAALEQTSEAELRRVLRREVRRRGRDGGAPARGRVLWCAGRSRRSPTRTAS